MTVWNWLLNIINVPLLLFVGVGGLIVGRFFARVVNRRLGRTGGELHLDCPTCWRRLSAGYRPPTPGEPPQQGIRLGDSAGDLKLTDPQPLNPGELELTCRCGTKVIILGLNTVGDESEGISHG